MTSTRTQIAWLIPKVNSIWEMKRKKPHFILCLVWCGMFTAVNSWSKRLLMISLHVSFVRNFRLLQTFISKFPSKIELVKKIFTRFFFMISLTGSTGNWLFELGRKRYIATVNIKMIRHKNARILNTFMAVLSRNSVIRLLWWPKRHVTGPWVSVFIHWDSCFNGRETWKLMQD